MLRIVERGSENFSIYKVNCVQCTYMDTPDSLCSRANITIKTDCGEIKLRVANYEGRTAKEAAEKISMSIHQDISIYIFVERDYLTIYRNLFPNENDENNENSYKVVGAKGHFDQVHT